MLGSSGGTGAGVGGKTGGNRAWPPAQEPPSRYGVYSLFPGAGSPAPGLGVGQALYHATHKVTDALFSSQYSSFGAPTPPPGSPYSPVPVAQLELLAKGITTSLATAISLQSQTFQSASHQATVPSSIQSTMSTGSVICAKKSPTPKRCCWMKTCNCHKSNIKVAAVSAGGCSRTNPVEWSGNASTGPVTVKREPGATPCQVAEVTTSETQGTLVKVEAVEEAHQVHTSVHNGNGTIPVGIAVARQRLQQDLGPAQSLLAHTGQSLKDINRIPDIAWRPISLVADSNPPMGGATGLTMGGANGSVLQCGDDRAPGLAAWPLGASAHAAPTLWQYPAPMPVEPMLPLPIPVPPLGYQLVRDPSSGHFLLIPTASLEQVSQAVVWPASYPTPSSHVLLPPPPPLAPLQLLSSSSSADFLATSTTLHQHTQTHSTRLVVTGPAPQNDKARAKALPVLPLPLPAHTLIKIEADCTATATLDTTPGPHTPFLLYQHPSLIIQPSQAVEASPQTAVTPAIPASCKSQATSPVACLTPPPETVPFSAMEVQDASNQTDHPTIEEEPIPEKILTPSPEIEPELPLEEPEEPAQAPEEAEVKIESSKADPDISGLELLSNSIAQFENITRNDAYVSPIKFEGAKEPAETGDGEVLKGIAHMTLKDCENEPNVEDNLGGLGLLCALAEQRFMEEVGEQRKEKRKLVQNGQEVKPKKPKIDEEENDSQLEKEKLSILNKVTTERGLTQETNNNCSCKITSKGQNWSPEFMSAIERDMRQELADLQRKCKEKKLELSKLTPKSKMATPPPKLDKIEPIITVKPTQELLKPPVLCPISPSKLDNNEKIEEPSHKRKSSIHDSDSACTTPEKTSSSKKRKVGRPKKLMTTPGLRGATTETIVAKKPRAKTGFVGYILAAKNRLQMQNKTGLGYRENSPPRYSEDTVSSPTNSPAKTKSRNTKNSSTSSISSSRSPFSRSKIRPKLKAEATLKTPPYESSSSSSSEAEEEEENNSSRPSSPKPPTPIVSLPEETEQEAEEIEEEEEEIEATEQPEIVKPEEKVLDTRCILTSQHLGVDKLRVLTAMGGLFYAGQLTAVRAPDVYAITLDGERGNRPHIMCREEILRDAIVEVSPSSTTELLPGTRLCAYWSQQYRCLYPGTVAEPGTPDPQLDLKFVCVEFDDGDSGRIALEDIRLLPADYPIIEYDPNPLLSLSKRRRRNSVNSLTDERRNTQKPSLTIQDPPKQICPQAEKENTDMNRQVDETHRERKRLKKRRKDKLKKLLHEDKKKKRKHRCCDEKCKHRKHHKKHRKHKKHHHRTVEENQEIEVLPVEEEKEVEIEEEEEEEEESVEVQEEQVESKTKKSKKKKERRESAESRSKMAAFLPARQLWSWSGRGYKRVGGRGRARKQFFKAIQRGKESIMVGDCAVFLSTGRPDRPYIGKIEAMWESWGTNRVVKVKWFYHPEETEGCPLNLKYPGALFESPHVDENDVQTISHKCEVLPLKDYTDKLGPEPQRYETIYDNNDIYYLAGYYDPTTTTLTMKPEIPFLN